MHFIDFAHRNGVEVSNHLKGLANELPATFIYVGVGLREKRFFDEGLLGQPLATHRPPGGPPAARSCRSPSPATPACGPGSRVLATLERHCKLGNARPRMLTDHARLRHRRTQGRIGSLTNLLERACYRAITEGSEPIAENLLGSVAIDKRPTRSAPPDPNPGAVARQGRGCGRSSAATTSTGGPSTCHGRTGSPLTGRLRRRITAQPPRVGQPRTWPWPSTLN